MKIKYFSLFSGIGAPEKSLDRLKINYELIGYSEIDKYASKSYSAIHKVSESLNFGDITKINEKELPKDIDLITYGFPCQDISIAGKMRGMKLICNKCGIEIEIPDGYTEKIKQGKICCCKKCDTEMKLTRSGLFFEALRIIEETQPRVAIAENVKALTSKKFSEQFKIVLDSLESAGYNNYWKVLNAKDFGVPQNRERVFIVSIRKDIDSGNFEFPQPIPLQLRLRDLLEREETVDKKYYLSESRIVSLIEHKRRNKEKGNGFGARFMTENDIASSVVTSPDKSAGQYLIVKEATKKGYAEAFAGDSINLEQPNSKTRRGRVGRGVAQTLTTSPQQVTVTNNLQLRKLTPLECFRLMGFDDEDFKHAAAFNSDNQLYKQAGNSIVVQVFQALIANIDIFKKQEEKEMMIDEIHPKEAYEQKKRMIDADAWIDKLRNIIDDEAAPGEYKDYCMHLINEIEAEYIAQE